ncbi:MAG: GAF domain-containing protein, partial [Terriglobus sp.]
MLQTPSQLEAAGLEVIDLADEKAYAKRSVRQRDGSIQMAALRRIAVAFVEKPETILQELVEAAVQICGADSAGISIEREGKTDKDYYQWIAIAGEYTPFLNAILPRT